MFTNKKAQELYSNANTNVRRMLDSMTLVVENENPERVSDEDAIAIAGMWERKSFQEDFNEALRILRLDIRNIRKGE